MACSSFSEDFSSLSLNESDMEMLPFQKTMNRDSEVCDYTQSSISSYDSATDSDSDLDEKYEMEESEKHSFAQGARKLELRNYQKELASNALQGYNTIICAPTGSGKTRVATYIIQEHFKNPEGHGKKVAFLARVVSLADQQHKSLCKYLPSLQIELITGESLNSMSLHLSIPHNDIIVMTPMILENHLRSKLVPHLGVFSMLVFDECHHTRKGEPYNSVMLSYHKTKNEINQANSRGQQLNINLPKIVGLTASIGIEGAEDIDIAKCNILKVCANLDAAKMSTIEDNKEELDLNVPVPKEKSELLSERQDSESVIKIIEVMQKLEEHMDEYIKDVQYGKLTKAGESRPPNRKSQEYEQWAINTMKIAKAVPISHANGTQIINIRLIIMTAKYLKEYRFALETYDLVELEDVLEYLVQNFEHLKRHEKRISEENKFYSYFLELKKHVLSSGHEKNPNLQIVAETLKEYLIKKASNSRGIIFVRTRALAVALSTWLNRCDFEELRNLNACSFTGANVPESKGGTSQVQQESIIERFRTGDVRLIVSTSVAEEGLDIPTCNLVIKYNHVGNEITTVQSRGRSRAVGGVSILLATNSVLQRERVNQRRAELMRKAIESIRKMTQLEFDKAIERYQIEILETMLRADMAEQDKKKHAQHFEILCSMCRKTSISSANVRTIFGKHHISIDKNLLKKTKNHRKSGKLLDEILFVGQVKCLGEIIPGKTCFHPLGPMIKYKDIYFIVIGITKVVFNIGNHQELKEYKKWKNVPFPIEELNNDDILRYVNSDLPESDDDGLEKSFDGCLDSDANNRQGCDTEVKRPY